MNIALRRSLPQIEEEISYFSSISDIPLHLCSLSNDSKEFIVYNIESNKICAKIPNPVEFDIKTKGCICELNGCQLFYLGGCLKSEKAIGLCLMINIKSQSVEVLSHGKPRHLASPVYFENFIYVFGGSPCAQSLDGSVSSEKFNLRKNKWKSIADLPMPALQTTAIVYLKKILISGCKIRCILKYDPDDNSYEKIFDLDWGKWKMFYIRKGRCYVITSGYKCYCSEMEDYRIWYYQGQLDGMSWPFSNPCYYNRSFIYFDHDLNICRFDLKKLKFKCLAKILEDKGNKVDNN